MNGKEFIRRARKWANKKGLPFALDTKHGKGSHAALYIGNRRTTVKHDEIGKGLLRAMLKQLDIDPNGF